MFNASNQAFEMTFQNGVRVRATWRECSYSDNRGFGSDQQQSRTAEVFAYVGKTNVWHGAYVKPDQLAKLLVEMANCNPYDLTLAAQL